MTMHANPNSQEDAGLAIYGGEREGKRAVRRHQGWYAQEEALQLQELAVPEAVL